MNNMNNPFQTSPFEKDENATMSANTTGKETYVSPKLVRIGSAAENTAFGGSGWDGTTIGS